MKRRYPVVFEKAEGNYGAHAPDIPGCASLKDTLEETRRLMAEGLQLHSESMVEDGEKIPQSVTSSFDFAEELPENGIEGCTVEWLEVELPAIEESHEFAAAD